MRSAQVRVAGATPAIRIGAWAIVRNQALHTGPAAVADVSPTFAARRPRVLRRVCGTSGRAEVLRALQVVRRPVRVVDDAPRAPAPVAHDREAVAWDLVRRHRPVRREAGPALVGGARSRGAL